MPAWMGLLMMSNENMRSVKLPRPAGGKGEGAGIDGGGRLVRFDRSDDAGPFYTERPMIERGGASIV